MIIVCDIDGTAANIDHRRHWVENRPKKWDEFYRAMVFDKPQYWCQQLLDGMQEQGHEIYFVTGRPDNYREETETWLREHYSWVFNNPLYMRKAGNTEQDYVVKQRIFDTHFRERKDEIAFVIDDRKQVVDMWRSNGLVVLQCDEGDF